MTVLPLKVFCRYNSIPMRTSPSISFLITALVGVCLTHDSARGDDESVSLRQFERLVLKSQGAIGLYEKSADKMILVRELRPSLDAHLDENVSVAHLIDSVRVDLSKLAVTKFFVVKLFNGNGANCYASYPIIDNRVIFIRNSEQPELAASISLEEVVKCLSYTRSSQ